MRRFLALTALLTLAGCGAPEPPTWDAWLQTGTIEVDTTWVDVLDEEVSNEGSATITTEIARGPEIIELRYLPSARWLQEQAEGHAPASPLAQRLRHGRLIHIPLDRLDRPEAEVIDVADLPGAPDAPRLRWPEQRAWQRAEATRVWFTWGAPWLDVAERGGGEVTMPLNVVGYEVDAVLTVEPMVVHADGEATAIARYRLEGVAARDVSGYFLRTIREAGDQIAWAHCNVVIEGELTVDVDLSQRLPLQSQILRTTTYSLDGSDPRVLSRSWREWTFRWPDSSSSD